jgi:sterol desaturase/sphingolipid hydroxylase (fatty acid hydroxylase superfamily)
LGFYISGIMNTIFVHSGYKFNNILFPDPTYHFLHHKKNFNNYGIGILDKYYQTSEYEIFNT